MSIEEYIESVKQALIDKNPKKVAELKKQYGNTPVTFSELEEAISYSIYNMTILVKGFQKESQLKHDNIVSVLSKGKVITERQAENIRLLDEQTEDAIDKFLKGDTNNGKE